MSQIIILEGLMKKAVIMIFAFVFFFVTILPAVSFARGSRHYRHKGYPLHYHYHNHGWEMTGATVGGLLLGAMIGSSFSRPTYVVRSRPAYVVSPPQLYYYPPPGVVYVYP